LRVEFSTIRPRRPTLFQIIDLLSGLLNRTFKSTLRAQLINIKLEDYSMADFFVEPTTLWSQSYKILQGVKCVYFGYGFNRLACL